MNKLYFLLLPLLPFIAISQPTITQSDLPGAYSGWRTARDTNYTASVPTGGANVTWNYSGLQQVEIDSTGFIAPTGTPYASIFPTANLAAFDWKMGNWSYWDNNSAGLYINGA